MFQAIYSSSSWKYLPTDLKPDFNNLLTTMIKSRSTSTAATYLKEINRFLQWCKDKRVNISLPFPSAITAVYLLEVKNSKSASSTTKAHAALKWLHSFFPREGLNPLDDGVCRNIVESAKRGRITPKTKKKPISAATIKQIIDRYAGDNSTLKDVRTAAMCAIGFAGFRRYSELSNIKPTHISFCKDYIVIFIPNSKTDVYREGNKVYIAKTRTKHCPVALLERYLEMANINRKSELYLFRRLTKTKSGYVLRKERLSYTRCREIFIECLASLGYDPKDYGLHSLRSGGITTAIHTDSSISERLLKLHGRWKTDTAKDMYVLESKQNRLRITKSLGL